MRLHRLATVVMLSVFTAASVHAFEKIDWRAKALTAGRASLASESYRVTQLLGVPNFSPEFRLPLELVYDSSSRRSGIFGYAWHCPQLESRILPKGNDQAEWHAPWGEKILFQRKQRATSDTIDYFREEMKGRGFFAAFSDWEADGKDGDWTISGKRKLDGWKFFYRGSLLNRIVSPGNRSLSFFYQRGRLTAVTQNDLKLVDLEYDRAGVAVGLRLNGVAYSLKYADVPVTLLPGFPADTLKRLEQQMLASWQRGALEPVSFAYDGYGFLNTVAQGGNIEQFEIEHETEAERRAYLEQAAEFRKERKNADLRRLNNSRKSIAGRILKDRQFAYSYRPAHNENTTVVIRDKAGRRATHHYSEQRGILTVTDFAGLTTTSYYFRRYDVAYNGKLRQVRDDRDRIALNCRYDKATGNITRLRDKADNDTWFTYDRNGRLVYVARQGADEARRSPLVEIGYDSAGNPTTVSRLDADGKPALTTRLSYNANRDVTFVANGQTATTIAYNAFGLPLQLTDIFRQITTYRYDAFNRVISVTAPNRAHTVYTYDDNGLVAKVENFADSSRAELLTSYRVEYSAVGRPVAFTDNQGRVRALEHDELGRVVKDVIRLADNAPETPETGDAAEFTTAYSYNVLGQLRRVLDRNGNPISFDWNKFGKLESRVTAAGQYTDYRYDEFGLLVSVVNRFRRKDSIDREFKYAYDEFDRVTCIDYGNGQKKHFQYDSWGRLLQAGTEDGQVRKYVAYTYDHFGRVTAKTERTVEDGQLKSRLAFQFAYNAWGQRVFRSAGVDNGAAKTAPRVTRWEYDQFGRLVGISDGDSRVAYVYNAANQLIKSTIDYAEIFYSYTRFGQLETKSLGSPYDGGRLSQAEPDPAKAGNIAGDLRPIAYVKYSYNPDGTVAAREVNNIRHAYRYDLLGQLAAVLDASGKAVEQYTYDPAGNILKKDINGKVTAYTYDKANQLVSSREFVNHIGHVDHEADSGASAAVRRTDYAYDAAGRLIRETSGEAGNDAVRHTEFAYGWLDKVMSITENSKVTASFDYAIDGQLANSIHYLSGEAGNDAVRRTDFVWDGLALISRNGTDYVNEPAVTGGNPILATNRQGSGAKALFNDLLGTTLGKYDGEKFIDNRMTAFGESACGELPAADFFFTGKPKVEGLGYSFLFRNYRPELGKWQTSDPLGYPDGWNNLAYVNNWVTGCIDRFGTDIYQVQDAQGAGGAGHTAWIVEKSNDTYYAIDYNPSNGTRLAQFDSLGEALAYLNQDNNRYEKYLQFATTKAHGDAFIQDMLPKLTDEAYTLNGDNNCYTAGAHSFNDTNPDPYGMPLHTGYHPNLSFTYNTSIAVGGAAVTIPGGINE